MTDPEFPIGAVLSVTDGRLLADIGDLHELLDHMTGEALLTHQLPRASRECEAALAAQHPELAAVRVPDGLHTWAAVEAFLEPLRARFGATVPVRPLTAGEHAHIDPIDELRAMRPDMPIVGVVVIDGGPDA